MTARDDYPALAWWCDPYFSSSFTDTGEQARRALDEIDQLRDDLATLYRQLGLSEEIAP